MSGRTISTYGLHVGKINQINLAPGAELIHIAFRTVDITKAPAPHLWFLADPGTEPTESRFFVVAKDDDRIKGGHKYIGTATKRMEFCGLVQDQAWHVFETVRPDA